MNLASEKPRYRPLTHTHTHTPTHTPTHALPQYWLQQLSPSWGNFGSLSAAATSHIYHANAKFEPMRVYPCQSAISTFFGGCAAAVSMFAWLRLPAAETCDCTGPGNALAACMTTPCSFRLQCGQKTRQDQALGHDLQLWCNNVTHTSWKETNRLL